MTAHIQLIETILYVKDQEESSRFYEMILRIKPDLEVTGIPRCELYFYVEDVQSEFSHAINSGATLISPPSLRSWGDLVCYLSDLDGHIIAFAGKP